MDSHAGTPSCCQNRHAWLILRRKIMLLRSNTIVSVTSPTIYLDWCSHCGVSQFVQPAGVKHLKVQTHTPIFSSQVASGLHLRDHISKRYDATMRIG